jgi:hypothetical protein
MPFKHSLFTRTFLFGFVWIYGYLIFLVSMTYAPAFEVRLTTQVKYVVLVIGKPVSFGLQSHAFHSTIHH